MTPSTLNRLVSPLWQAGVPRPHNADYPLTFCEHYDGRDPAWLYAPLDDRYPKVLWCDDATAAERIEFGVDRWLDGEELNDSGRFAHLCDAPDKQYPNDMSVWSAIRDSNDGIRLLAKIALAYALLGMEMPKEEQCRSSE